MDKVRGGEAVDGDDGVDEEAMTAGERTTSHVEGQYTHEMFTTR